MWQYMKSIYLPGLVRGDWDSLDFQIYHGHGKWVPDRHGVDLWSGRSSASLDWVEISEEEAKEVMKEMDKLFDEYWAKRRKEGEKRGDT